MYKNVVQSQIWNRSRSDTNKFEADIKHLIDITHFQFESFYILQILFYTDETLRNF